MVVSMLVVVLWAGAVVFAWNDVGHLTVAHVAYDRLTEPERNAVVEILKKHPHFDNYLKAGRPAGVSEVEWVFCRAATWSDFVRAPRNFHGDLDSHPVHKFHRGAWHFINFPYKAGEHRDSPPAPLPTQTDILKQLDRSIRVLNGSLADDTDRAENVSVEANKAVRLCWVFHLIGDLHQPLHVTALVDNQKFPPPHHGDQGGNKIAIRASRRSHPTKLHSYWDGLLGFDSDIEKIRDLADDLNDDPDLATEHLPELTQHTTFKQWAEEGYQLAQSKAYLDGRLEFALWDDFDHDVISADEVPVLPASVRAEARETARKRVVLASHRLAAELKKIVH